MLDRPIVAFDIETIPDPDIGRRILGIAGSDAEVVHEMVRLRLEETSGSSEYPQLPWHRVVSICTTTLDPETGKVAIRALGGAAMNERSHIEGFFKLVTQELVASGPVVTHFHRNHRGPVTHSVICGHTSALVGAARGRGAGCGRHGRAPGELVDGVRLSCGTPC